MFLTTVQIWSQLNLKASVPADDVLQDGLAHIAISHSEDEGAAEEQRFHRIFNKVPAADTKPPESMPNIQLQVVRYNMDFLEPKVRLQMKRSSTSPSDVQCGSRPGYDEDDQNEVIDTQLHEATVSPGNDILSHSLTTPPTSRKRKRPGIRAPSRTKSSPLAREAGLRTRRATRTAAHVPDQDVVPQEQLAQMQGMVEGAMRLSISGTSKSSTGIKVKANTFAVGLADVAPVLWRPGYLFVGKAIRISGSSLTRRRIYRSELTSYPPSVAPSAKWPAPRLRLSH